MLRKDNLTFVTSVTFKIKVTTPKRKGFLRGLLGSYIPSFKVIAKNILSYRMGMVSSDRQTDRWTMPYHNMPILQWAYKRMRKNVGEV